MLPPLSIDSLRTPDDEIARRPIKPVLGMQMSEAKAWELCYQTAWKGAGKVGPNPLVGAVLVSEEDCLLGVGAHQKYGSYHAERDLFYNLDPSVSKEQIRKATLYSSLEPCCHTNKKTPPCCTLLLEKRPKRVKFACVDPNPQVSGQGQITLSQAGIDCQHSPQSQIPFEKLLERFRVNILEKRPFVGMKIATSLDGAIGYKGAQRLWITGERSREYGHFLRTLYEGIAIGANTFLMDNPSLTSRCQGIENKDPVKILLDPNSRCAQYLENSNLSLSNDKTIYWVCKDNESNSITLPQIQETRIQIEQDKLNLGQLLSHLYSQGVYSILLEGGRGVWSSFWNRGFIDKIHHFQSAAILGSTDRMNWSEQFEHKEEYKIGSQWVYTLQEDTLREVSFINPKFYEHQC